MNIGPAGMRQITTRMRRGMPIPAAMLQTLIDNDRTQSRKIAARPGPVIAQKPVRFHVSFDTKEQRIYVSVGTVATHRDPDDDVIRPMMPTINGDALDAEERPFIEYGDFDTGEHEIVCAFNDERAQIQVLKDGEVVAGHEGGSGEEEDNDNSDQLLLATVNFSDEGGTLTPMDLKQIWASDIAWQPDQSSSESGSSGSSQPDSSEESQPSQPSDEPSDGDDSEKSTAIVPAYWTKGGYTALFCVEAPDVRFTDILRTGLSRRVTRLKLDPRYVAVCEPDSIEVVSVTPEQPMRVGARVEGGFVILTRSIWSGPCRATVYVSGIRKGFAGLRFPDRNQAEFKANERFLKSARPRK